MIPFSEDGQLVECLRTLDELGYDLANLSDLSDVHLQAIARNAIHLSMPEELRETRLTMLQELIWQCGRRRPRVALTDHVKCASTVLAASQAARKLCWSAVAIRVDGVLRRVGKRDPHYAMQLRLQAAFGIRRRQLFGLCPHFADLGDVFQVSATDRRGQHWLPIDNATNLAVVDAAKALVMFPGARLHPQNHFGSAGQSYDTKYASTRLLLSPLLRVSKAVRSIAMAIIMKGPPLLPSHAWYVVPRYT
jgi:hypothetical protein